MPEKTWVLDEYAVLMKKVSAGDTSAFEKIVGRFSGVLTNYFYRLCRDRDVSEDLSQETLLKIWRGRESYRIRSSFTTFLFTVAVNVWRDEYRTRKHKPVVLVSQEIDYETLDAERSSGGERDSSVEKKVMGNYMSGMMERVFQELDEAHKEPFLLSEVGGLTYEQIAAVLDIPVGTVRSRKFNAYRKIREKLKKMIGNER